MAHVPVLAAITPLMAIAMEIRTCRARLAMRAPHPAPLAARPDQETAPRHDDQRLTAAARPAIDVLLRDGVDETALAAARDTYGATFTGRLRTVSHGARPVRSRHGLTLVPRGSVESATTSRLLAPHAGGEEADPAGATALPQAGSPYGAIHDALDDLGRHAGRPIARFAAKT